MKIRYKAGYKYQLAETVSMPTNIYPDTDIESRFIGLSRGGTLTIKVGYAWDGPSGPTIDTKTFMRGSLAHDAVYQLMREGTLVVYDSRRKADKLLRDICVQDGMWKVRAWWVYRAVRYGAEESSITGREIIEAP